MWKDRVVQSQSVQGCAAGIILLSIVVLVGGWLGMVAGGLLSWVTC